MVTLRNIQRISSNFYSGSLTTIRYEFKDRNKDAKDLSATTPKLYVNTCEGTFLVAQEYDSGDSTLASGIVEFDVTFPTTGPYYDAVFTVINGADFTSFSTMSVRQADILQHALVTS